MQLATHRTGGEGPARPVLLWRFSPAMRAISSAVLGGGIGPCSWVLNAEVALQYDHDDPAEHVRAIARELGLSERHGAGLLTAARVRDVASAVDGDVTCDATVGVSLPTWAASRDARDAGDGTWVPGTINLVCRVPAPLSDAALVNAVITATEAKTQAMVERGVDGTGTASDAVVIVCPPGGAEPYGGPRSRWGAPLARAVHAAVTQGLARALGNGT